MSDRGQPFDDDDDDAAAQYWLTVLRDGDDDQKVQARDQLAAIFERRAMFDEAADLLVSNIRAGVKNADIFRRLSRIYRAQGDEVLAMQAAAEAARYLAPAASSSLSNPVLPTTSPQLDAAPPRTPRPWYLSTAALIVATALCFPPLAIVLVWIRPWQRWMQIALTIPLCLWMLAYFATAFGAGQPRAQTATTANPTAQSAAQAPAPKVAPTPRPPTPTAAPPTATLPPPTATPRPDPALAQYVDPRELTADAKAFQGRNIILQGKALTVTHNAEQKGILSDAPDHTWMQVMAIVRGRTTTESLVVEFHPRDTKILKDECYRIRGIVQGTTKVRRQLTGAEGEAPIIRGYAWEKSPANQFGTCQGP